MAPSGKTAQPVALTGAAALEVLVHKGRSEWTNAVGGIGFATGPERLGCCPIHWKT